MVIGFKKRFEPSIVSGLKVHTIRADKGNRWKPGTVMHMATGTRTKNYNCFMVATCQAVQSIVMQLRTGPNGADIEVYIDDKAMLTEPDMEKLAISDGFTNMLDFKQWWVPELVFLPSRRYEGKIIHWTDLRY